MSVIELGALGEFVAAIGVLVTLIYLAVQIRQTKKVVMAQAFQHRSEALQDISMRLAESESLSAISARLRAQGWPANEEAYQQLPESEQEQYRNFLTAHLHRMTNLIHQYDEGLLTEKYYQEGIRGTIVMWHTMWQAADVRVVMPEVIGRVYQEALALEPGPRELASVGPRDQRSEGS